MSALSDLFTLNPSALIELYDLDMTPVGGTLQHFHAGTNELRQPVTWCGIVYQARPIDATGFQLNGAGSLPRPTVQISNIGGLMTWYMAQYLGLIGAKLTRRRTCLKYLDAVNFADGNPAADPTQEYPQEIWIVDRKSGENRIYVSFELAAAIDVVGVQLPRRQLVANLCPWQYRIWMAGSSSFDYTRAECPYVGTLYFDISGNPVTDPAQDVPSKKVDSCCKTRFGSANPLPYGGFPAAGLVSQ